MEAAMISQRRAIIWCVILLSIALVRVHFRVVTTNVAYHLGQLKTSEGTLLEKRAALQAEWAKLTGKRQLQILSDDPNDPNSKTETGTGGTQ